MTEKKSYTIYEVQAAECTLEPMKCIHCGHVGEVTYYQDIKDAHCAICGEWQLYPKNVRVVTNKKELLVAFKESYFFDGETRIILHHKNGTTEYKIYCPPFGVPLKCFEKAFKRVLRKINRTHSKYFI